MAAAERSADYGIDAPPVIGGLALGGALAAVVAVVGPRLGVNLLHVFFWPGLSCLATGAWMYIGTRYRKGSMRDSLLEDLELKGDEAVLDVGCGRGLLLIGAARALTTGKAVGLDLWRSIDQSGNAPEQTRANAEAEGVAERITLETGDMRKLPFADASFDLVLSSLAIHNVPSAEGRAEACREMARVLKPGGRVAVLDIFSTAEYVKAFETAGLEQVERSFENVMFATPTFRVTARKPA
ncbi:MAG: class I SAM-dependent methyltransferase [Archangiaceae bacterium]|nr:class I SAM-dependent methyltransferase [Archangiaceae bacterium]